MTKKKSRRTIQTPKPRNERWMRASLDHHNRNNTQPSGKAYRRPSPGRKWE